MNQWETDFSRAVAALEIAYDDDARVYAALKDDTKASWSLRPMPSWPASVVAGPMARARATLIAAEDAVRAIVARRSIALRQARARRAALHERSAFAPTTPMVLEPSGAFPVRLCAFEQDALRHAARH